MLKLLASIGDSGSNCNGDKTARAICVGDADAVDGDCDGSCHCLQQWRYIIPNCGVQVRIGGRW